MLVPLAFHKHTCVLWPMSLTAIIGFQQKWIPCSAQVQSFSLILRKAHFSELHLPDSHVFPVLYHQQSFSFSSALKCQKIMHVIWCCYDYLFTVSLFVCICLFICLHQFFCLCICLRTPPYSKHNVVDCLPLDTLMGRSHLGHESRCLSHAGWG